MANVLVKWNMESFRQVRTSPEVSAAVRAIADRIANQANSELGSDGYVARESQSDNRARAVVITATAEAIRNEAANGSALRAMGGG